MKTSYRTQTVNGNYEVIKVVNGIAKEIVAGERNCITKNQAKAIVIELTKKCTL